jgi:hypothetical protein
MKTTKELHKIKEAFAYAILDMLDAYDELLTQVENCVAPEPTINDLIKSKIEHEDCDKI